MSKYEKLINNKMKADYIFMDEGQNGPLKYIQD